MSSDLCSVGDARSARNHRWDGRSCPSYNSFHYDTTSSGALGVPVEGPASSLLSSTGLVLPIFYDVFVSGCSPESTCEKCIVITWLLGPPLISANWERLRWKGQQRAQEQKYGAWTIFALLKQVASHAFLHFPLSAVFISGIIIYQAHVLEKQLFDRWEGIWLALQFHGHEVQRRRMDICSKLCRNLAPLRRRGWRCRKNGSSMEQDVLGRVFDEVALRACHQLNIFWAQSYTEQSNRDAICPDSFLSSFLGSSSREKG